MKQLSIWVSLILFMGCSSIKNTTASSTFLSGTWVPVKQEMNGKELPPLAFTGQKLTLKDSTYIFMAESLDKGIVHYKGGKMDIFGKEGVNKGKHFTAIYKYANGQLTVCYNLLGDSYPESFETKSKRTFFLSIYKRE